MGDIILTFSVPGKTDVKASVLIGLFDEAALYNVQYGTIYGAAIGACSIMMAVLWLIVNNKKTPIFIMNQLTLAAMIVRSSLYVAYLHGPLANMSYVVLGLVDTDDLKSYNVTLAANCFQVIVIALIECSMTFQVYMIFRSPEVRKLGYVLSGLSGTLACLIVGLYINYIVENYRYFHQGSSSTIQLGGWKTDLPSILFCASINAMSIMLITKLIFAIKTRRYLGLRQFDSFHILLIVTSQTMIVPSILVLVNYANSKTFYSELITVSIFLVVLSLPLSSMWAAAANNSRVPNSSNLRLMRSYDSDSDAGASTVYSLFPKKCSRVNTPTSEFDSGTLNGSPTSYFKNVITPTSATTEGTLNTRMPPDLEGMADGISANEMDRSHSLSYNDCDSVEKYLNNVGNDQFLSVQTRNVNVSS
ncbi:uncharacterized protein PRCAT00005189001 [Priceomyces carsonii]|uniref:uncharacterized protein n=1 Tax=Priceomyces carsonii TaxID=28549 RepID=UPI002EDA3AF6|nr:unnamed protein product [Priceomyces carsonii]